MVHVIRDSYRNLPIHEYAYGAVECALAHGTASHVILYSVCAYREGGLYLAYTEIPFGSDVEAVVKKAIKARTSGQVLKVIDLSEDYKEQLKDIDEVYTKVTGMKFSTSRY